MKQIFILISFFLACTHESQCPPVPPAPVCPSASVVVKYVDLEVERFKRDYDSRTGKRKVTAICETDWVHWSFIGQVDWCKAKASEFDCGYDSWMDAWPPAEARPWTSEGSYKSVFACCSDDPASQFDCTFMKERARVCDELKGQSHKITCRVTFCENKRKVCL